MAAEQFNDPYWVAIAAAAPVIGLASAVIVGQLVDERNRDRDRTPAGTPVSQKPSWTRALWISYLNLFLQVGILGIALQCLSDRTDLVPRGLATTITQLSMLLVLVPSLIAYSARRSRR